MSFEEFPITSGQPLGTPESELSVTTLRARLEAFERARGAGGAYDPAGGGGAAGAGEEVPIELDESDVVPATPPRKGKRAAPHMPAAMPAEGGPSAAKKKTSNRVNPARGWCFTLNNYTEEQRKKIIQICLDRGARYVVGKEVAPSTGTPHLQGYVCFLEKVRPMGIFNIKEIHWEVAHGTMEENLQYCTKEGDYSTNIQAMPKLKVIGIQQMYPWQRALANRVEQAPDDRKIIWVWDEKGATGKTAMCRWLAVREGACLLGGDTKDGLYVAGEQEARTYIFSFPRTNETGVKYDMIESIKDGIYTSTKYEGKMVVRGCPHVICFANYPPYKRALSEDRWEIYHINNDKTWTLNGEAEE